MIELTRDEARELAVAAQGLARSPGETPTVEDMVGVIGRLGCVQIDTIHVVARSQYVVLWSRLGGYDPTWLNEMLHPKRELFEYWAHAASLIPTDLFPYFLRRMRNYRTESWHARQSWTFENAELINEVLQAVREHGPIGASHFEAPKRNGRVEAWDWWGGKPTNRALDILWTAGELTTHRRANFQRVFDLTERVFPEWYGAELPDPIEERRMLARRAARAMGVVLPRWLNDYYRTKQGERGEPLRTPAELLADLAASGHLIPVSVTGLGEGYVAAENAELLDAVRGGARAEHVTFLSPFDNLIWDRKRTQELFDFEYRIECYTPAPKRRYGYFTLPILYRGRLIGRIDPKADRKNRVLILKSLHLEPGAPKPAELVDDLRRAARAFADFNGCDRIQVEAGPARLVKALNRA